MGPVRQMDNYCPNCDKSHLGGQDKCNFDLSLHDITKFNSSLTRDKVNAFEDLARTQEQVPIETKHYFSKDVYAREVFIPKGLILTGHIHKYTNLNIISKGKIRVLIDDKLVTFEAPATIVSPPGTKRVVHALEDTVWTTIHGTNETDIDIIEQTFIAHTEAEYLEFERQLMLPFEPKATASVTYLDV